MDDVRPAGDDRICEIRADIMKGYSYEAIWHKYGVSFDLYRAIAGGLFDEVEPSARPYDFLFDMYWDEFEDV